jgi:hypothetical protein
MMLRLLLALLPALTVQTAAPPTLLPGADTPPRGLNTWDSFRYWASEADLLANAKAMNESGMVATGWQYLVVDEGWYRWSNNTSLGQEQHQMIPTPNAVRNQSWAGVDQNGRFTPSLDRFPSAAGGAGLKPLCSRLAAMGVLCGVHLINGLPQVAANLKLPILGGNGATCDQIVTSQPAGSPPMCFVLKEPLGAEARAYLSSLVAQLQGWGVRFIKWDFGPSSAMIEMMVELIEEAHAEILLSVNAGPQPLASMYRISNDVWDVWDDVKGNVAKIAEDLPNQRPGNWPDADMLPLGRIGGLRSPLWDKGCDDHPTMLQLNCGRTNQTGFRHCECCPRQSRLTHTEGRALLSLWYIGRSPLMFGGFLPETDSATIALLANHLALGANTWGRNVSRQVAPTTKLAPVLPKLEAWVSTDARDTTEKTFFVGLFNFMDDIAPQMVTATLPAACEVAKQVTDLWTSNESRAVIWSQDADGAARVSRKVGPHDSALLSVQCGSTRSIPMKVDEMGPIPRGVAAVAAADVERNNIYDDDETDGGGVLLVAVKSDDQGSRPACPAVLAGPGGSQFWRLESLACLGGHRLNVSGSPKLVTTPLGTGVQFDGVGDALFLAVDPIANWSAFTAEIYFRPHEDGLPAQRFLHIQAEDPPGTDAGRVLFELRQPGVNPAPTPTPCSPSASDPAWGPRGAWFADSFVSPRGLGGQTQFGAAHRHPISPTRWYTFAATVGPDPATGGNVSFAHFVNGVEEMRDICCTANSSDPAFGCAACPGPLEFVPHKTGRISIGVRINSICHFKGTVAAVRFTPRVLAPHELMQPEGNVEIGM